MVDIRLITILPTQPVTGVAQPPIAQGTGGQAAGLLAELPVGSILSGFIINRDVSGNPILRSEKGDIVFSSQFFLKIGSDVTIRIEQRGGNPSAKIISVNGQPPEVAELQSAYADEPEFTVSDRITATPQRPTATAANLPPISQPSLQVRANVLSAPEEIPTSLPLGPLVAGTEVSVQVLSVHAEIHSPEDDALLKLFLPQTSQPTAPSSTPNAPVSYAAYAKYNLSPLPPQPASTQAIPTPATTQAPTNSITATVIAHEPDGAALLQTPAGTLRLPADFTLPKGVTLQIRINPEVIQPEQRTVLPPLVTPAPLTELAQRWQSLEQISSLLSELDIPTHSLPTLLLKPDIQAHSDSPALQPHKLLSGLMLFISALRGNDFEGWLGREPARRLQELGHGALLAKAEGEFQQIAKQFVDPPPQQWQALFFPVMVHGELHQTRLFVKRDRKSKDDRTGKKEEDTRFVVEIDLSMLGAMQMDGFVRKQEQAVEFDLMMRSQNELPQSIRQEIIRIYNEMGEITGYKGQLLFQATREFPVRPMEEMIAQRPPDVIV